jgi:DNA-directed RNA polymerase subunit RPC12/RpoP
MKSRKILCPDCGNRMKRKYGYKKAWYNAKHAYKTVYDCDTCGKRLKILAMDEDAFMSDRTELVTRLNDAERRLLALNAKLNEYRDKTSVSRLQMELDALEKQMNYVRKCLKNM